MAKSWIVDLTDDEIFAILASGFTPSDLISMSERIVRNAVQCLACDHTVESTHRHDMRWCPCKNVAVDGGRSYLRRVYSTDQWTELSERRTLTASEMRTVILGLLVGSPPFDRDEFSQTATEDFRRELVGEPRGSDYRADPIDLAETDWFYGPTDADPDPGKRWHVGCGGEIWTFDGGLVCRVCGVQGG